MFQLHRQVEGANRGVTLLSNYWREDLQKTGRKKISR